MPDFTAVVLLSAALIIALVVTWACLLSRRHTHLHQQQISHILSGKMWVGPNPIEEAAAAKRRTPTSDERRALDAARKEKVIQEKTRALMRGATNYARSLRSDRKILQVDAFIGWREDKLFTRVDDAIINATYPSLASTASAHAHVDALMWTARLRPPLPSSAGKITLTDARQPLALAAAGRGSIEEAAARMGATPITASGGAAGAAAAAAGPPGGTMIDSLRLEDPMLRAVFASPAAAVAAAAATGDGSGGAGPAAGSGSAAGTSLAAFEPVFSLASDTQQRVVRSLLLSIRHPYICPILDCGLAFDKAGVFVVRPYCAAGSLRDLLWDVDDPSRPYSVKYPRLSAADRARADHTAVRARPLKPATIAKFGRHILEALAYLDRLGLPMLHLHLGNVLLREGRAELSEYEQLLFGMPPAPRDLRRLQRAGPHDPVVIAFCGVIYEMATGEPFDVPAYPHFPAFEPLSGTYDDVADVLKFVFMPRRSMELDASGRAVCWPPPPYVTVHDLLKLPMFAKVSAVQPCPDLPAQPQQPAAAAASGGFAAAAGPHGPAQRHIPHPRGAQSVTAASASFEAIDVATDPRVRDLAVAACERWAPMLPLAAHTLRDRLGLPLVPPAALAVSQSTQYTAELALAARAGMVDSDADEDGNPSVDVATSKALVAGATPHSAVMRPAGAGDERKGAAASAAGGVWTRTAIGGAGATGKAGAVGGGGGNGGRGERQGGKRSSRAARRMAGESDDEGDVDGDVVAGVAAGAAAAAAADDLEAGRGSRREPREPRATSSRREPG